MTNNEDLYPMPHIVAYIDIIGYKNIISKSCESQKSLLKAIDDIAEKMGEWIKQKDEGMRIARPDWYMFSDNIVIWAKYNEPAETIKQKNSNLAPALMIFGLASMVQYHLLATHGILSRGAVTAGSFYIDENKKYIFGKALVDAYQLESECA
jgi:hypothetical protein